MAPDVLYYKYLLLTRHFICILRVLRTKTYLTIISSIPRLNEEDAQTLVEQNLILLLSSPDPFSSKGFSLWPHPLLTGKMSFLLIYFL